MELENPVATVISAFGGIRPMAEAIGEQYPNVVQNWKKAGRIPHYRALQIRQAAEASGVIIEPSLLARACAPRQAA